MQKKIVLTIVMLLLMQPLIAQYSPAGSPQFHFQGHGGASAACPYIFMASMRTHTPFFLKSTNMLLDANGDLIWYQQTPMYALDFGIHPDQRMAYNDNHFWHILDSTFTEVDSVRCIGYRNDIHDMRITADGHYFLICIEDTIMDLSMLLTTSGSPGATNARVDAVVIQELDAGKNVVKEWHGLQHYQVQDPDTAYFQNPFLMELNHTNSIALSGDGKMLLSHRALHEITQVDWATGNIDWHLGGKLNEFDLQGDSGTIGQHDARYLPNGRISTFDNGNGRRPGRALIYALDTLQMQASKAWEYANPAATSDAMGSFMRLADSSAIIGFGRVSPTDEPVVSLIASDGSPIFDIRFFDSSSTYRAMCADLPFALHRPLLDCQQNIGQAVLSVQGLHARYEWTSGENTASIVVSDTGWYQVFVPQGVGMISSAPIHITNLANACAAVTREDALSATPRHKLIGRFDLLGRPLTFPKPGQIYLDRYSDGSSCKRVGVQ